MDKKLITIVYSPAFFSGVLYFLLAYFTPRTQFGQLFTLVSACFILYVILCRQSFTFGTGLGIALVFRLIFLGAYPNLSDDYFRFFWDGTLLVHGENPYLHLPSYYIQYNLIPIVLTSALYKQLNSPQYYSVYPPVCQFIFALVKVLAPENILTYCFLLRLLILAAETTSLLLLRKILHLLHLPEKQVWLYGFNPLVILELTGNLHFEAFMILALLLSIYLLLQHNTAAAAVTFGLAVNIKLLPLIFLPPLIKYFGWRKFILFAGLVGGIILLTFIPFISEAFISHIGESVNLYFQKFEFNASIYYLLRWLGFKISGYNQIALLGPFLGLVVFTTVFYLTKNLKPGNSDLIKVFLISLSVYFFLATVVHTWYITTLVALAVLTRFQYPLLWSLMAFLSYSAYQTASYHENLFLIALEYSLVFGLLLYELKQPQKTKPVL